MHRILSAVVLPRIIAGAVMVPARGALWAAI